MASKGPVQELAGDVVEKESHETSRSISVPQKSSESPEADLPTCVIVLGMAGSGKTTFVKKLSDFLSAQNSRPYLINLDPAVRQVPYPVNIDIRDTVKYKAVMERFGLGPNGAIMTSLNLFTTKFSGVLDLLEKRKGETEYMVFDTPGQIEVFTWSASGTIITEALADVFPTVVVYVMDVNASTSPITFMSNMLYACSILYKSKLPFVIALNKVDLADPAFAIQWMTDFEAFELAIDKEESYAGNLSRSLGLILDEFYEMIKSVPVSAQTGKGFPQLIEALVEKKNEYVREYKPELMRMKEEQKEIRRKKHGERFEKLRQEVEDLALGHQGGGDSNKSTGSNKITLNMHNEAEEEIVDRDEETERREEESFRHFLGSVKKNKDEVDAVKRATGNKL